MDAPGVQEAEGEDFDLLVRGSRRLMGFEFIADYQWRLFARNIDLLRI